MVVSVNLVCDGVLGGDMDNWNVGSPLVVFRYIRQSDSFHPRHVLSAVENMINKYSLMKEYFKSSRSSLIVRDGITMHKEDELLLDKIIKFIEDNIDDESMNPDSLADFIGVSKAEIWIIGMWAVRSLAFNISVRVMPSSLGINTSLIIISGCFCSISFSASSPSAASRTW